MNKILHFPAAGLPAVNASFRNERIPAGDDELLLRSTCLECGESFVTDLRAELLAAKLHAHIDVCNPKRAASQPNPFHNR
jgi:hypothetical protein